MKPISAITIEFTAKVSLDIWELEDIKYSTPLASVVIGNVNIWKNNVFVTFIWVICMVLCHGLKLAVIIQSLLSNSSCSSENVFFFLISRNQLARRENWTVIPCFPSTHVHFFLNIHTYDKILRKGVHRKVTVKRIHLLLPITHLSSFLHSEMS